MIYILVTEWRHRLTSVANRYSNLFFAQSRIKANRQAMNDYINHHYKQDFSRLSENYSISLYSVRFGLHINIDIDVD